MKNLITAATVSASLALAGCDAAETPAEDATQSAAIADNDNDAAVPVAEPHDEDELHDESVPHDH